MSVSVFAISNSILDLAEKRGICDISPMKLQKLLYYTQGWHLGVTGREAFFDQVEAWRYGPVVRSVYIATKQYGNDKITGRLCSIAKRVFGDGKPDQLSKDEREELEPVLNWILHVYGHYTATQLSNMTHIDGGPWKTAIDKEHLSPTSPVILVEIMKNYFQKENDKLDELTR